MEKDVQNLVSFLTLFTHGPSSRTRDIGDLLESIEKLEKGQVMLVLLMIGKSFCPVN